MNVAASISELWPVLGCLVGLLCLAGVLRSPWAKGLLGELLVRLLIYWQLDQQTYRRLHNVTLNTLDGTTQIDHVVLSPYGIFVLETKNMSGWIFGGEKQPQWTQKLYKHSFKFQNPLRQNFKHLKALEVSLGVSLEHLHSVIVFIGGSRFKTEMPVNVTQGIGFIRYIKSFQQPVFTETEVDELSRTLQNNRRAADLATHREHVQNLQSRHDPSAERKCPKCGSPLLIRTIKSGPKEGQQFWGCSAFPKCRIRQSL